MDKSYSRADKASTGSVICFFFFLGGEGSMFWPKVQKDLSQEMEP